MIWADAKRGVYQTPDGNQNKPTYNKTYAKYKANYMQRFTSSASGKKGQKIKSYYSTSVSNNDTNVVNMSLTERTFKYFIQNGVKFFDSISVTLGYNPVDSKKIIGNAEKYNRQIVGLNNENKAWVKKQILEQFNENIRKELKDITINVRF